jgi:hypothetical protein
MENTLPGQFSLHTSYRKTDDCVKIRKKTVCFIQELLISLRFSAFSGKTDVKFLKIV